MKLAIIGSRDFHDFDFMEYRTRHLKPDATEIVSGGAKGADRLAERYAEAHNLKMKIFPGMPGGFLKRNREIVNYCDEVLAFWNGYSTGTEYTIKFARAIGKPVTIVKV